MKQASVVLIRNNKMEQLIYSGRLAIAQTHFLRTLADYGAIGEAEGCVYRYSEDVVIDLNESETNRDGNLTVVLQHSDVYPEDNLYLQLHVQR